MCVTSSFRVNCKAAHSGYGPVDQSCWPHLSIVYTANIVTGHNRSLFLCRGKSLKNWMSWWSNKLNSTLKWHLSSTCCEWHVICWHGRLLTVRISSPTLHTLNTDASDLSSSVTQASFLAESVSSKVRILDAAKVNQQAPVTMLTKQRVNLLWDLLPDTQTPDSYLLESLHTVLKIFSVAG